MGIIKKVRPIHVGNKTIEAPPVPQPERPEWLTVGALVTSRSNLGAERRPQHTIPYLVPMSTRYTPTVVKDTLAIYMGEERLAVTGKKGIVTKLVVHAFLVNGSKYYAATENFMQPVSVNLKQK